MFGYIYPNKMELKVREFYDFKGYYCGLCKTLKKDFGQIPRLSLNYDNTFLTLLLSSLYDHEDKITFEKCIASPFKKNKIIYNEFTNYSANINILLAYNKLLDDWNDDKSIVSLSTSKLLYIYYKKAKKNYPQKNDIIKQNLKNLNEYEKKFLNNFNQEQPSLDIPSNYFGELLSEIFVYKNDEFSAILKNIGFHLGKFIYILDAYDDASEDIKKNRFNPLKLKYQKDKASLKEEIETTLFFILNIIAENIQKLNLKQNKPIIENIIFSGLYLKTQSILNEIKKNNTNLNI